MVTVEMLELQVECFRLELEFAQLVIVHSYEALGKILVVMAL